ncbi:MAG: helix-turn-helix transcriptional regulator [Lachnospiraceae bacterium]|nr:helix-turn-helix transcriptional regulator [Lachnospiraceae bacterium]
MPRNKTDSHEKIIKVAMEEFLEYGFMDASMRRIAGKVGMTVSALYKHFPSKEDMFAALVEPVCLEFRKLYEINETEQFEKMEDIELDKLWDDGRDSQITIGFIYDHLDEFKLIVSRSKGTRYESFVHDIAVMEENTTLRYIKLLEKRGLNKKKIDPKELHLLITVNVDAVFQTVEHDFTRKQAMHYAKTLDEFFTVGWKKYFGLI